MLQWLAVLVLGHNVQENPDLLRGAKVAARPHKPGLAGSIPASASTPLIECGCCKRTVPSLDGLYLTCNACAECLSLGHCYDPDEGDRGHNVRCCHGENHSPPKFITRVDHERGEITVSSSALTPEALAMLETSGQVVTHTQPPPAWQPPLAECQFCSLRATPDRRVVLVQDELGHLWAQHEGGCEAPPPAPPPEPMTIDFSKPPQYFATNPKTGEPELRPYKPGTSLRWFEQRLESSMSDGSEEPDP